MPLPPPPKHPTQSQASASAEDAEELGFGDFDPEQDEVRQRRGDRRCDCHFVSFPLLWYLHMSTCPSPLPSSLFLPFQYSLY